MNEKSRYKSGEKALTPSQVETLFSVIDNLMHEGLFKLAVAGGLRRDDVVHVRQADVNAAENTVTFFEKKKKRTKVVYVSSDVMKTLSQIKKIYSGETYLFPGRSEAKHGKGHVSSKGAYNLFQMYLLRAGLKKRPFHALRATCIKICQSKGWSPEQTAKHVGDKISTIQEHYLTPSNDEMKAVALEKPLI